MTTDYSEAAQPELEELQQREIVRVTVPVEHIGPVTTNELPSRIGPVFSIVLSTAQYDSVLGSDPKRRRATLVLRSANASDYFLVSRTGSRGSGVPWPANVALMLRHCDTVWASLPGVGLAGSDGTLSVLSEEWAD